MVVGSGACLSPPSSFFPFLYFVDDEGGRGVVQVPNIERKDGRWGRETDLTSLFRCFSGKGKSSAGEGRA